MEFVRAAGLAFVVLILDVLLAVGVVYVWGKSQQPGHPEIFYQTAAISLARWSTRIAGTAMIFIAAWAAARKRMPPQAYYFALAVVCFYAFLDGASIAFADFFNLGIALTMGLKLAAALGGAALGVRQRTVRQAAVTIR
jgi:zinc transporter ZupT